MVRPYRADDLPAMRNIWNEVVEGGVAFPQTEPLSVREAEDFFAAQSLCAVAETEKGVEGLYVLHPNNVGRCGHIANASYAVSSAARGKGLGEMLVRDCLDRAKGLGFRIMQFNAVVASNKAALALYEKLGFVRLGTVPGGFLDIQNAYQDIVLFYKTL